MSANLPILTKLGHYCMPVVTACYSCQTGFSNFAVTPNYQVEEFVRRIVANVTPTAVYVGFCNDTATLKGIKQVISDVLPNDRYLFIDPIMGDNGKLYPVFDKAYVDVMRDVVMGADCISPNLTEACLLVGADYNALTSHSDGDGYLSICKQTFVNFLTATKVKSAVITGITHGDKISNLVLDGNGVTTVTTERVNVNYSGTGDVFSSVLLGELLCGKTLIEATKISANFVSQSSKQTERIDRRFGIDFCKLLNTL